MKLARLLAVTLLAAGLVLVGCKKKPPEQAPVLEPAPAPAPQKQVEVPKQVSDMVSNFSRVYFEFDSAALSDASRSALDANASIMAKHPDIKVEIQGHADERGTTDYNLALGQRRANAVYRYLTSKGVAASRLKVVSYGEERPLVPGHSERAWSQNRRAEFVITWGDTSTVKGTADK